MIDIDDAVFKVLQYENNFDCNARNISRDLISNWNNVCSMKTLSKSVFIVTAHSLAQLGTRGSVATHITNIILRVSHGYKLAIRGKIV